MAGKAICSTRLSGDRRAARPAMTDDAQAALKSGGTTSAEAASLYAQGLQAVPIRPGAPHSSGMTRSAAWKRQSSCSPGPSSSTRLRVRARQPRRGVSPAVPADPVHRALQACRGPLPACAVARWISVGQAWQTLGNIHTEVGRAEDASQDFEKARARLPRSPEVHRDIAAAYTRMGAAGRGRSAVPEGDLPAPGLVVDLLVLRRVSVPCEPLRGCRERLPTGADAGARTTPGPLQPRRRRSWPGAASRKRRRRSSGRSTPADRVGGIQSRHAALPAWRLPRGGVGVRAATTASAARLPLVAQSRRRATQRRLAGRSLAPSRPTGKPSSWPSRSARSTRPTGAS